MCAARGYYSNYPARMTSGRTVQTASSGAEAIDEVIADEPPRPPGVRRVDWSRTLAAAKKEQQAKDAGKTMAHESGQEAQQDQLRHARAPRNVQAGLSVAQPIDELHAAKMPRLGERAPPEKRPSIDDSAMANKAGVPSAAKSNKAILKPPQRTLQAATIPPIIAPAALTAATMATDSEGANGESAAAAAATQPPMNDDAAAARPASSRPPGATPRSEQGRKHKNARTAARRKERAQGQTGAPDTDPPETKAQSGIA